MGLVDDTGRIWIGGDSAGVEDLDLTTRADRKIFYLGGPEGNVLLLGFSGSFRVGQLLRHKLQIPKRDQDVPIEDWMHVEFLDRVRNTLSTGGVLKSENRVESFEGSILVGTEGRLFKIECDLQIGEHLLGFDACGSGRPYAMGSLWSSREFNTPHDAQGRLDKALNCAEAFSAGVRGPYHVLYHPLLDPV